MSKFKNIIDKFNKNPRKRQELLKDLSSEQISDLIISSTENSFGFNFYCAALSLINDEEKLFEIIENVLPRLNRDELSVRALQDFYARFCIELNKKSLEFVIKTAYLCHKYLLAGESRAIFYKDILPITCKLLSRNETKTVNYESELKTCKEHRQEIINEILRKPFSIATITNLVSMFKDIELSPAQQSQLIVKISQHISQVSQSEIANLALVTFYISSYSQIIIPLLALDKYFSKRRYRFEMSELLGSDSESIEETSTQGIAQAEETIIYHFQNHAESTTLEKDVTNSLKSLEYTPHLILSPFLSIILVSIAKISSSVQGNFRLNQSTILPFIKQVFKFNEEHKHILKRSNWAKTIDPIDPVNTEPLLKILKQNTCGLKQDLALNGLFGLSFLLLKTKSSNELNSFAIDFLNEILKNRPEFTSDILHIIVKMLFCEKNKAPIIECFSSFVQNRYLDISASEPALRKLIEDLTELDLETALSIENSIFTAITKSINLRDLMIDVMKKAMYQRNIVEKRKMAVLSFCIMLRKFTKTRSIGNQPRFLHNISMFSLTQSQIAINTNTNRNVRQAEIIMLEILGLLRRCFSENIEIKVMLYESLFNTITVNKDIIPYIVEFLDGHFRMYFEIDDDCDTDMMINFEKLFNGGKNADVAIIMDDLGQLLKFIINCIVMTVEQHEKLNCDIQVYEKILKQLMDKCLTATMEQLHVFSTMNFKNGVIVSQFLNCLEALMLYCHHRIKDNNENISTLMMLFNKHQMTQKKVKKLLENSKKAQKSDRNSSSAATKRCELKLNCIWNLTECCVFLKAFFSHDMDGKLNEMKQDKDFCKFILDATVKNLKSIETASEYTKMKYSRAVFEAFLCASMIIYQQMDLDVFRVFYNDYSDDCAASLIESFNYAVYGMEASYAGKKDKWNRFLKLLTKMSSDDNDEMLMEIIYKVHAIVEWGFDTDDNKDFVAAANGSSILNHLFLMLEIFYKKLEDDKNIRSCFNWILTFCKKTSIKQKSLSTSAIKLLFECISQHENSLLIDCIAHKIAISYKYRRNIPEPENFSQNNLSIISKQQTTVDEAFIECLDFIKSQLNILDIYIKRANSFNAFIRLDGRELRQEACSHLQQIETAICTKLISLGKSIERIASSNFPITTKCIEKVIGIANVYYKCIENLMKHFRKHHDIKKINYQCIGIEELIKYSKTFAICVYGIAPYIETSVDADFNDSRDKKEARNKKRDLILNKTTKLIPRMIFLIETFNKSVNVFDAAAKTGFNRCLHAGEIRDFHIRNSVLFEAVEASQATARSDESMNGAEKSQLEDENDENVAPKRRKRKQLVSDESSSDDDESRGSESIGDELVEEIDSGAAFTKEQFEKNVEMMAKGRGKGTRGRKKRN